MFTFFSKHALQRLAERTSFSPESFVDLLEKKIFINVGKVPGFNREHLLFYSPDDDDFFVAVRDNLTGTVVTILPLDFHENLAWQIKPDDCDKAKSLFLGKVGRDNQQAINAIPKVFIVSVHYRDENWSQKTKQVLKLDSSKYSNQLSELFKDPDFYILLDDASEKKGLSSKYILGISVRHGNKGSPIMIDLHCDH